MIKTIVTKLKQVCNDCAIPSFSINKKFNKIAESFGVIRGCFETSDTLHACDLKESEEYLVSLLNIDVSALHSFAVLKRSEAELSFKKKCEQTAIYMCNDYQERAKNVLHRKKYTKCLSIEQERLNQIREEIERLSEIIKTKEVELESLDPDQYTKVMFVFSCWEYRSIASTIPDLIKDLTEIHNSAKIALYHFMKHNEMLSLSWTEERFNDISGKMKDGYQKLSDQLLLLNEAENNANILANQIFIKGSDPIVNTESEKCSDGFGWTDNASWY